MSEARLPSEDADCGWQEEYTSGLRLPQAKGQNHVGPMKATTVTQDNCEPLLL